MTESKDMNDEHSNNEAVWYDDVVGNLETFTRLSKAGHFERANLFFERKLKPYSDEIPIAAQYADSLIDQGAFRTAEEFLANHKPREIATGSEVATETQVLTVFRLMLTIAQLYTKFEPVRAADVALSAIQEAGTVTIGEGMSQINLQIMILSLRIIDLVRRVPSLSDEVTLVLPFETRSQRRPELAWEDAIIALLSSQHLWEAQTLLAIHIRHHGVKAVSKPIDILDAVPKRQDAMYMLAYLTILTLLSKNLSWGKSVTDTHLQQWNKSHKNKIDPLSHPMDDITDPVTTSRAYQKLMVFQLTRALSMARSGKGDQEMTADFTSNVNVSEVLAGLRDLRFEASCHKDYSLAMEIYEASNDILPDEYLQATGASKEAIELLHPDIRLPSHSSRSERVADEDDSYDSDDEQVELAQTALVKGNRAFDAKDWNLAVKILHTSLKLLHKLPHHKRQQDIFGLQYRLAVCSYHTGDVDHAEAGLESLLQHEPVSDKEGVQLCDARHLLSRIYVERGKLEPARDACASTLKARSRLLGKQHAARFESMALMSRILQLLDDEVLSDLYASRIPDAHREDLLAAVSTLQPKTPLHTTNAMLALPMTSEPVQYTGSNPHEAGTSPRTMPVQSHTLSYGPLPSLSPNFSPLSVSPKSHVAGFPSALETEKVRTADHTSPSSLDDEEAHRRRSTISRSPNHDAELQTTPGTSGVDALTTSELPVRPPRIYSAPVISVTPTQSTRKPSRAPSIVSIDEPQEGTYLPIRAPSLGGPVTPSVSLSRSERHKIVKRFKMERQCMHNLDQSICDGTLENSLTLVATLHSNSTGNPASQIVFNQWADGLRLATKSPALHLAILFGDDTLVEPLIKNGFSPTFSYQLSGEPGMRDILTPLDIAIASRNEPIIRQLLENGAVLGPSNSDSPCRHLLSHASLQMWPPCEVPEVLSLLQLLLSCGWPVSKSFSRQNKSSSTPTFLHQACSLSVRLHEYRLPLVEFLIEQSDTATLSAPATETPLHHAVRRDDAEVVDSLLQARASFRLPGMLEKKNSHDCQPLYLAVQRAIADHDLPLDIVRSLLNHGANLDEPHTLTEARLLRPSKKTRSTARSIAMASGRQDLIALVQSVG